MPRGQLRVRAASHEDLPALLALGEEIRDQVLPSADGSLRGRGAPAIARAVLEQRYAEAIDDPHRRLVVAVGDDDEPIGMALFTLGTANALLDVPAVSMSHAVVGDRHKRRGAGKALVAAAAAYADEVGVDQLVVSVHPGSRDANRFFARLGFAPLAVRRTAPVSAVRRRLAQTDSRTVADHVVRRRPLRGARLPHAASVPLGPAGRDTAP